MPTHVQITGLDELDLLVQNLNPEITKQFQEITDRYAQTIVSEMNSIVPVDTGFLKSTIGSSSSITTMEIYVDAPYAGFVNYGTRRQKAQPYFSGPVERNIQPMVDEINQAVANYIASNIR